MTKARFAEGRSRRATSLIRLIDAMPSLQLLEAANNPCASSRGGHIEEMFAHSGMRSTQCPLATRLTIR